MYYYNATGTFYFFEIKIGLQCPKHFIQDLQAQRLLDHSTFTMSHADIHSQFIQNLEDDVIPESTNNVRIHFL